MAALGVKKAAGFRLGPVLCSQLGLCWLIWDVLTQHDCSSDARTICGIILPYVLRCCFCLLFRSTLKILIDLWGAQH
ncbi:MAG: hypothetical protein AAFR75_13775, partial [Pseudomonadota bacterium]